MTGAGEFIRVIVADHQEFSRVGIATLLDRTDDIRVVGRVGNAPETMEAVDRHQPDVVLVDSALPSTGRPTAGLELVDRLTGPRTGVIVMAEKHNDDLLLGVMRAGARGYVLKDTPLWALSTAIRSVAGGDAFLAGSVISRAFTRFTLPPKRDSEDSPSELAMLNDRELQVLVGIGNGLLNKEIARRLGVSENTIKTYASNLICKLGVRNRVGVALTAYRLGLAVSDLSLVSGECQGSVGRNLPEGTHAS